jgi:hypothetical protein
MGAWPLEVAATEHVHSTQRDLGSPSTLSSPPWLYDGHVAARDGCWQEKAEREGGIEGREGRSKKRWHRVSPDTREA